MRRENTEPLANSKDADNTSYTVRPERVLTSLGIRPATPLDERYSVALHGLWEETKPAKVQREAVQAPAGDNRYSRLYDECMKHMPYRYPNPGMPRNREGSVGGSWRHVRDIANYNGSRLVYMDGINSVYDTVNFTQELQSKQEKQEHLRAFYQPSEAMSPPATSFAAAPKMDNLLKPTLPASSIMADPDIERKLLLQERFPTIRRGFYEYKPKVRKRTFFRQLSSWNH
ncbi:uncharacterized protein LOC112559529 isoform X2 [Pomacea canaliculata]|uniref:uncharacterized protein LOC112559529 isoform X2 n=1 Tax=Pomacea canaliculata TaxID=400727 RepID=UPI000D7392C3|nr:uncharacterized protein LOC112559529 isoform X2 [Pomacea canaliculata]